MSVFLLATASYLAGQTNAFESPYLPSKIRPPYPLDSDGFRKKLREILAGDHAESVFNPLEGSAGITNWARSLTKASTNELQMAAALFNALSSRTNLALPASGDRRNAQELFKAWDTRLTAFDCQGLSLLYTALARAVGLESCHVWIDKDSIGKLVLHECAAVFTKEGTLLVDPAYFLFGVKHEKFELLDDVETTAIFLCGTQTREDLRLACKLAPTTFFVHVSFCDFLVNRGLWEEAQVEMATVTRLDPQSPLTIALQAKFAEHEGKLAEAIEFWRKCSAVEHQITQLFLSRGDFLARHGMLEEALRSYQQALDVATYGDHSNRAAFSVALLQAIIALQMADYKKALFNYEKAIELDSKRPEAYAGRATIRFQSHDYVGAEKDYDSAIQLYPSYSGAYLGRGLAKRANNSISNALADISVAAELSPKAGYIYSARALVYFDMLNFQEALDDLKTADALGETNVYNKLRLCLVQQHLKLEHTLKDDGVTPGSGDRSGDAAWPRAIAEYLHGQVSESGLLELAEKSDLQVRHNRLCECYFYVGSKHLIRGDRDRAITYFRRCEETGATNLDEYVSSRLRVNMLRQPGTRSLAN